MRVGFGEVSGKVCARERAFADDAADHNSQDQQKLSFRAAPLRTSGRCQVTVLRLASCKQASHVQERQIALVAMAVPCASTEFATPNKLRYPVCHRRACCNAHVQPATCTDTTNCFGAADTGLPMVVALPWTTAEMQVFIFFTG